MEKNGKNYLTRIIIWSKWLVDWLFRSSASWCILWPKSHISLSSLDRFTMGNGSFLTARQFAETQVKFPNEVIVSKFQANVRNGDHSVLCSGGKNKSSPVSFQMFDWTMDHQFLFWSLRHCSVLFYKTYIYIFLGKRFRRYLVKIY